MAIFVIRHGETDLNAGRVIQWPDTPLSVRGTRQAKAVGERFSAAPIGKIIASDYARAYSTAEAIQAANGAPLEVVTTLRERHYGD
ncbi:MAG: histidine phosphatase family protein, partial [Gammaproteobacteria bacterium]